MQVRKVGNGEMEEREVHRVQILDPACGTGSFLLRVIDEIHATFKGDEGSWAGYVREHLLPRLHGFELMMAPYTVAHMKIGMRLKNELDAGLREDERLGIYLTNALENPHDAPPRDFLAPWLVDEAEAAWKIKSQKPILVILGNPPYSGHSANDGKWMKDLLRGRDRGQEVPGNYFQVDGKPLGERNPKWLNDDYVKFLRWAQWRIERSGQGIVGMITNHGYLDNPTFRGMRQSLMQTFDKMYILDLHGNDRKKEKVPEEIQKLLGIGPKDQNVFDIQQGVAICLLVKLSSSANVPACESEPMADRDVRPTTIESTTKITTAGRVKINKHQYFEGVAQEVWDFHVGGYKVCEKWLKDRKGRELSFDDKNHYKQIISILGQTIKVMKQIDKTITKNGDWPIK